MPLSIVSDIVEDKKEAKQSLFDFMDKEYDIFEKFSLFSYAEEQTVKFWNEISEKFAERVENLTSRKLDDYKCLLSMFLTTSAWNEDVKIRRNIKQLSQNKFIIAFEVLLSHSFKCVRDLYSEEEIASTWDVWGFSEITASFLIRDEVISKIFPDLHITDMSMNYFEKTAYKSLIKLEDVLKKI